MASPTSRTMESLREQGFTVEKTEYWNSHTKQRKDLFGFADILAFKGKLIVLIQVTSKSNMSARIKKVLANDNAQAWMKAGHPIWVVGWKKYTEAVDRKFWRCDITVLEGDHDH